MGACSPGAQLGELPKLTIVRAWQRARTAVFTLEVAATVLAKTSYDLCHAAVSTWLNGRVPPTTVAEWAGHSVEILLKIYAKCLDGSDAAIRRRVQVALGHARPHPARGSLGNNLRHPLASSSIRPHEHKRLRTGQTYDEPQH